MKPTLMGIKVVPLKSKYTEAMSNWLTLSDIIYSDEVTPTDLHSMLAFELGSRNRKQIIDRLFARYNKLVNKERKVLFMKEQTAWTWKAKKTQNPI